LLSKKDLFGLPFAVFLMLKMSVIMLFCYQILC